MFFSEKGYCRFCGSHCLSLKLNPKNPHISFCQKIKMCSGNPRPISRTTPIKGNIKAPAWCPKLKKH